MVEALKTTHDRHTREFRARYEPPPRDALAYKEGIRRMYDNVFILKERFRSMKIYIPVPLETMLDDYSEWVKGRADLERDGCLYESGLVEEISPEESRHESEKSSDRGTALQVAKEFMLNPSKFAVPRAPPETILELPESAASTGVVPIGDMLVEAASRALATVTGINLTAPPQEVGTTAQVREQPVIVLSSETIDLADDEEEDDKSYLQISDTTVLRPKGSKTHKGGRLGQLFHTARKTVGELTRSISDGGKDSSKNRGTSTGLRLQGQPPPPLHLPLENTVLGEGTQFEDALD